MNGFYQIFGEILKPVRDKIVDILELNRESLGHKLLQMIGTFALIDFSWIFFRANGFMDAIAIIKAMSAEKNPWILFDSSIYNCGLDSKNFCLVIVCIAILIFADFCKHRGIKIHEVIIKQDWWFRWLFIAFAVSAILLFGMWGPFFQQANFIYFQF